MQDPYAPPPIEVSETSTRTWVATGFAILTGLLSILVLVVVASNFIVLLRLPALPIKVSHWVGIIAMTTVMLFTSLALAHISIGLFRSQTETWKRGLWILLGCVLAYSALVFLAVATPVFH